MKNNINSVFVIGAGNVAYHLLSALKKEVQIVGIHSKGVKNAKELSTLYNIKLYKDLVQIPNCDLVLICTNDDTIHAIIKQIPSHLNIAYTSGSIELPEEYQNVGVFYPLQTFSKNKPLNLSDVPFLIEANNEILFHQLFKLGQNLSSKVIKANSSERKKIHLAAVFINNFTNHMTYISSELMKKNNLDWELLLPLLKETISKIEVNSPFESQTGPARRNDNTVIQDHLNMLENEQKEIYQILTKNIIKTYNND